MYQWHERSPENIANLLQYPLLCDLCVLLRLINGDFSPFVLFVAFVDNYSLKSIANNNWNVPVGACRIQAEHA